MDAPHDEPMPDDIEIEESESRLPLSDDEQRALELYDRLQELRLEIAIINAQQSHQAGKLPHTLRMPAVLVLTRNADDAGEEMTPEEATAARNNLLETRAKYLLRNQVIDSVLSANPILKAVHNGTEASPVERDLLPYIQQRDEAAIDVAKLASATGELRGQATRAQSEALRATRQNVTLAAEVMDLVAQIKEKKSGYMRDEKTQQGIQRLEDELKSSRQRWRIMKGITGGVVAGSGVDWARDETLRDLVLDPEDDD
ncbi:hypothetical protein ACO1O0_001222 [Amphichorda felina]